MFYFISFVYIVFQACIYVCLKLSVVCNDIKCYLYVDFMPKTECVLVKDILCFFVLILV